MFDEIADPYLRERKGDVADLVGRLKMNLRHGVATPRDLLRELDEASVLIADELTPSLAAQVDWTKVRGFATDAGSRTYHTAILARSLDVPAVVGLHDASRVDSARPARRHRRDARRGHRRARRGGARARGASAPTISRRRAVPERRAPAAGDDRRRRAHPARREHRVPGRSGRGAICRRRRDRAVPIGVPADGRRRVDVAQATRTSSTRSTAACSKAWRPGR